MADGLHIATIEKNKLEEVRIALTEYNKHELVDIRVYQEFDGSDGEKRPTKKGITLNRSKLGALIEALQRAERGG